MVSCCLNSSFGFSFYISTTKLLHKTSHIPYSHPLHVGYYFLLTVIITMLIMFPYLYSSPISHNWFLINQNTRKNIWIEIFLFQNGLLFPTTCSIFSNNFFAPGHFICIPLPTYFGYISQHYSPNIYFLPSFLHSCPSKQHCKTFMPEKSTELWKLCLLKLNAMQY